MEIEEKIKDLNEVLSIAEEYDRGVGVMEWLISIEGHSDFIASLTKEQQKEVQGQFEKVKYIVEKFELIHKNEKQKLKAMEKMIK